MSVESRGRDPDGRRSPLHSPRRSPRMSSLDDCPHTGATGAEEMRGVNFTGILQKVTFDREDSIAITAVAQTRRVRVSPQLLDKHHLVSAQKERSLEMQGTEKTLLGNETGYVIFLLNPEKMM